jgi:hypothetical protein
LLNKGIDKGGVAVNPITFKPNQKTVKDSKVKPNTAYYYALKVYWTDGKQNALSEVVVGED